MFLWISSSEKLKIQFLFGQLKFQCELLSIYNERPRGKSKVHHSEQMYTDLQCNMYKTEGAVGVQMQ